MRVSEDETSEEVNKEIKKAEQKVCSVTLLTGRDMPTRTAEFHIPRG